MIVIVLLLCAVVLARVPTSLSLTCNAKDKALAWINGTLDVALLTNGALFGFFECNGNQIDGCFETLETLDGTTCIAPSIDESVCSNGCNFDVTLEDTCCGDPEASEDGEAPHMDGESVCQTNRRWIWYAFKLIDQALDKYNDFLDDVDPNWDEVVQLACKAEKILSTVLPQLDNDIGDDDATYRHIFSPKRRAVFVDNHAANIQVLARTIQSFRACPGNTCKNHTLVATYSIFTLVTTGPLEIGTHQLLWPISGTTSAFDKTGLPHNDHCSLAHAPTGFTPATNPAFRLSTLGHLDYAQVVTAFSRCDGFPRNGCVKTFSDLSAGRCCNTLTLIADMAAAANLLPFDTDPVVFSYVYVAHFMSTITYESDPERDVHVETDLVVRTSAADSCLDTETGAVTPASIKIARQSKRPLTMPLGESQCVGGPNAGKKCTARNECGSGLACSIQPGTKISLCFDGTWWNKAMPCTLNSQCPYGECYGAVSGDAGGEFPYLHVWNENHCDDPESATVLCNDPRVREWYSNPRLNKK